MLEAEHNHFQYLRRVICDNVELPPDPSPAKLGDYLEPHCQPLEQVRVQIGHRGKKVTRTVHNTKKGFGKRTTKKEITRKKWAVYYQILQNTLTHKMATQMVYNPFTRQFFIRNINDSGKLQAKNYVENTHEYNIHERACTGNWASNYV